MPDSSPPSQPSAKPPIWLGEQGVLLVGDHVLDGCRSGDGRGMGRTSGDSQPRPEVGVSAAPDPTFDLARQMPWAWAEGGSWWLVSGQMHDRHTFSGCIARVIPEAITGGDVPLFEVLVYGSPLYVGAEKITAAKRLIFVMADDPTTPLYDDDRDFLVERPSASTAPNTPEE